MNRNWMLALALLPAWPGAVGRAAEEVGAAAADPAAEPPGEYALLRREISLLNLLRGLYLSDGQLAALAPLARAAEEARAAAAAAAAAGGAELQAALR